MPEATVKQQSMVLFLAVASAACAAQSGRGGGFEPQPLAEPLYVRPSNVPQLTGVSAGVRVGLTLYVSAQVSLDSLGQLVGPDDPSAQAIRSLENVFTVVRAGRGVPADLVKLTIYYISGSADEVRLLRDSVVARFPPQHVPAITMVSVPTLPMPGLLVSIEGIAMLRSEFPDRARDHL